MTEPTMTVAEELMAQRDAVLFGTWVQGTPNRLGEACAAVRTIKDATLDYGFVNISANAAILLGQDRISFSVISWNDTPGRTREEVLDLLDDGIRRAKELGI